MPLPGHAEDSLLPSEEETVTEETTLSAESTIPASEETEPTAEETAASSEETALPPESASTATEPPETTAEESTETATETTTEPITEESSAVTEASETQTEASSLTEPEASTAELAGLSEVPPKPARDASGPGLYFGLLHAHTNLSDGEGSVEDAFQYAANVPGLDFFAVTDHSNSFDNGLSADLKTDASDLSRKWAAGKAAADAVTGTDFVGMFGFEMSWPSRMQLGHINTFATPGFVSWEQADFISGDDALTSYYRALAEVPGSISLFCHPGTQYGTFSDFAHHSREADDVIHLLEVGCGEGTIGGSSYERAFDDYIRALDKGWHLAPSANQANHQGNWGDANSARTVVWAQSLTEAALFDAIRDHRVYATEDSDLQIHYTLDGHPLGSRLARRHIGETADILVDITDPTDASIGRIEVIAEGGTVVEAKTLTAASGSLSLSLSGDHTYYLLKITQPDGDIAVTAPVWVEQTEQVGISALTCETEVPVQNEPVTLTLALYNRETVPFRVEKLEILANGSPVFSDDTLTSLPAGAELAHPITLTVDAIGAARITARLTGSLEGSRRVYEETILLSFTRSDQVTSILVDGSHGNAGLQNLDVLSGLAGEENIRLTIARDEITAEDLKTCRFLLVTAPAEPFRQEFLDRAAEFASYGGSIILCGQTDRQDAAVHTASELNRLLTAVGSSLRLQDDEARDPKQNGGKATLLLSQNINTASVWCDGISDAQLYRQNRGCTVDIGNGLWLVRGEASSRSIDGDGDGLGGETGPVTLLACEALPAGGTVFAAGGLFLGDQELAEPKNIWDPGYANRALARKLLGIGGETLPLSTVRQAREAAEGTLLRIRGYVTAGTSNPYTTFPDTLYLQDDTGGIAVIPFAAENISIGTPIEITGTAALQNGNRILHYASHKVLAGSRYRYLPKTGSWKKLLQYDRNGGRLVQVEGVCQTRYLWSDGTLAAFVLRDDSGSTVRVEIEQSIRSHATGENTLHETVLRSRIIRAMGILHINGEGETVIRVRNCEEVVWIPPKDYVNPKTADPLSFLHSHRPQ